MKQLTKRILSLAFALMLFASVAGTAFATDSEFVGIYLSLGGTCTQSVKILYGIDTTTFVTKNPDSARLVTTIQFSDGLDLSDEMIAKSNRGVTEFEATFGIADINGDTPIGVYSAHEVRDGTSEQTDPFVYHDYTDMSDWEFP